MLVAALLLAPLAQPTTATATTATAITAGALHTCALSSAGAVLCWGSDEFGQLGDGGSNTDQPTPVAVSGLTGGVTAITAGFAHTCALNSVGGVLCWGFNSFGQLGDGSNVDRPIPVAVSGLASGVTAIAAGGAHTCAATTAGAVLCWGWDSEGQLGNGSVSTNQSSPVPVSGITSGVAAIAAGDHTCALTTAGAVLCWGQDGSGELGDGEPNANQATPVAVIYAASGVSAIEAGRAHTCAISSAGSVRCWGDDSNGQVGDGGADTNRSWPVTVSGLTSGVSAVSAGGFHTCAITSAGAVRCWGSDSAGQLGDGGSNTNRSIPVAAIGLTAGIRAVAAGGWHTCALTSAGAVLCWGSDSAGQLGDGGSNTDHPTAVAASGLTSGVTAITAGGAHTCARTSAGALLCWGSDYAGQLGDGGTNTDRWAPVTVSGLSSGVSAISAGGGHTCATTDTGLVFCWGGDNYGQVGDGGTNTNRSTPVAVSFLTTAIDAGSSHTCAVTAPGAVLCWGGNYYGQLGDGSNVDQSTAVAVSGLTSGVTAIATGGGHSCALTNAGAVLCWGNDDHGQLGDGGISTHGLVSRTPVAVSGLSSGVAAISAGVHHTCALTDAGAVLCWGSDTQGQLGDNTDGADQTVPVAVSGLSSGVTAIAAGDSHTCALTATGAVLCWGWDFHGELGDGDGASTEQHTPVAVSGLTSGVTAIAAGANHTCAISNGCTVLCWGADGWGQLGRGGSVAIRSIPGTVSGFLCDGGDLDGDGTPDTTDNCRFVANPIQTDGDSDAIGDACDNCPATCNPDQGNSDGDTGGGDVCDVCPAIDEAAEQVECASATHDSALACCRDGASDGVSVDADGPSCGVAADVTFQTPPDPDTGTTVTARIPSGAVSGPTSISVTPMTRGGSEYVLSDRAGGFVTGAIMEPDGMSFSSPLLICMAWQDADNDGYVDNLGAGTSVAEANIRPTQQSHSTIRGLTAVSTRTMGTTCSLQAACGARGPDGLPATVPGTLFDPALAACCSATENVYCFEVNHFSAYAIADLSCTGEASARITATRMDKPTGAQGLKVKGEFNLGGAIEDGLDPVTSGFELAILSAADTPLYQVTLPAGEYSRATGEGWKLSARGGSGQWQSRTGIDGVTRVKLAWDDATGQGSFDVKGKDLSLAVTEADLPLRAEVRLDPADLAGRCGAASFLPPDGVCALNGSGSTLLCK